MDFKDRYLLACLAEECAEVQQEIMKIFRFGLYDVNPKGDGWTNAQRLNQEMVDLLAVMDMVRKNVYAISETVDSVAHLEKQGKVNKWLKYAQDREDNNWIGDGI